jgi:hypothetical protein
MASKKKKNIQGVPSTKELSMITLSISCLKKHISHMKTYIEIVCPEKLQALKVVFSLLKRQFNF